MAADNLVETDKTTDVAFTMKIGALTDTRRGDGQTPDRRCHATPRPTPAMRREEFEKLPVGRSYQALIGAGARRSSARPAT